MQNPTVCNNHMIEFVHKKRLIAMCTRPTAYGNELKISVQVH